MSEVELTQIDVDGVTFERKQHEKFQRFIVDHNGGGPEVTPLPGEMPPPPR